MRSLCDQDWGAPVFSSDSGLSVRPVSSVALLPCPPPSPQLGSGRRPTTPAARTTPMWMWRVCGDGGAGSPALLSPQPPWVWRTRSRARVQAGCWASPSTCVSSGPSSCWAWGSSSSVSGTPPPAPAAGTLSLCCGPSCSTPTPFCPCPCGPDQTPLSPFQVVSQSLRVVSEDGA